MLWKACASRILRKLELSLHVVKYTQIYTREFDWNPNSNALKPVGWCVAAQLPVLSPSSILLSPLVIALSVPQGKVWLTFLKMLFPPPFFKVEWIWDCVTWNCINLGVSVVCDEAWHFLLWMLGSVFYVVQKSLHWIEMYMLLMGINMWCVWHRLCKGL